MRGFLSNIARQLLRDNAAEHATGYPELGPPDRLEDPLWQIGANGSPNRKSATFHGSIVGPIPIGPAPELATDAPPTRIVAGYAKARHGHGVWGMEPLIPEGETR